MPAAKRGALDRTQQEFNGRVSDRNVRKFRWAAQRDAVPLPARMARYLRAEPCGRCEGTVTGSAPGRAQAEYAGSAASALAVARSRQLPFDGRPGDPINLGLEMKSEAFGGGMAV